MRNGSARQIVHSFYKGTPNFLLWQQRFAYVDAVDFDKSLVILALRLGIDMQIRCRVVGLFDTLCFGKEKAIRFEVNLSEIRSPRKVPGALSRKKKVQQIQSRVRSYLLTLFFAKAGQGEKQVDECLPDLLALFQATVFQAAVEFGVSCRVNRSSR